MSGAATLTLRRDRDVSTTHRLYSGVRVSSRPPRFRLSLAHRMGRGADLEGWVGIEPTHFPNHRNGRCSDCATRQASGELRRGEAPAIIPFLGGSRHEQDDNSAAAGRDETADAHSRQLQDSPPAPERLRLSSAWHMALSRVAWSYQRADAGRFAGKGSGGTCRN
jgi:hypothetical protein